MIGACCHGVTYYPLITKQYFYVIKVQWSPRYQFQLVIRVAVKYSCIRRLECCLSIDHRSSLSAASRLAITLKPIVTQQFFNFQVLGLFNHWRYTYGQCESRSRAPLDHFETRLLMICICSSRLHPHVQRLVLNGRSYLHVIYRHTSSTCSCFTCICASSRWMYYNGLPHRQTLNYDTNPPLMSHSLSGCICTQCTSRYSLIMKSFFGVLWVVWYN